MESSPTEHEIVSHKLCQDITSIPAAIDMQLGNSQFPELFEHVNDVTSKWLLLLIKYDYNNFTGSYNLTIIHYIN